MTSFSIDRVIGIDQVIGAPPAVVYRYFVDPDKLARWHGVEAEADARVGGAWRCRLPDGSVVAGTFFELSPR